MQTHCRAAVAHQIEFFKLTNIQKDKKKKSQWAQKGKKRKEKQKLFMIVLGCPKKNTVFSRISLTATISYAWHH